jgi:hypothetical protein
MTQFTDRAADVKAALQDYIRDAEADLAKIARWRGGQYSAHPFKLPLYAGDTTLPRLVTASLANIDTVRTARSHQLIEAYKTNADQAHDLLRSDVALTSEEAAALQDVRHLIDQFKTITNHDDAAALVATFTE